jgi:Leucine-rich repeat (LRR) protein
VLSSNAITQLPGTISQLTALSQLKLNQNQLSELPPVLGRCQSLREVDVSSNQLTVLSLHDLISLQIPPDVHNILSLQCTTRLMTAALIGTAGGTGAAEESDGPLS